MIFGSDHPPDAEAGPGLGEEAARGDAKTLVLSVPALTAEVLERFLAYQRDLLERLALPQLGDPSQALAAAHAQALESSGLARAEHGWLRALADAFCGRRAPYQQLRERLGELRRRGDLELTTLAEREATRLGATEELERRYGATNIRLLLERESALLVLHHRVLGATALRRPSPLRSP
jgi:hypothetical protein